VTLVARLVVVDSNGLIVIRFVSQSIRFVTTSVSALSVSFLPFLRKVSFGKREKANAL
jgi:hypothetical protein